MTVTLFEHTRPRTRVTHDAPRIAADARGVMHVMRVVGGTGLADGGGQASAFFTFSGVSISNTP